MDAVIPSFEVSDRWLAITVEDMAKGIAAAEADVPVDEFAAWHQLMESAVKPSEKL